MERVGRCVEEDAHLRRVRHLAGRDERELVEQALGVLHDADDGFAALGPGVPDPLTKLGGQARREGDLIRPSRVVPREQLQHRPPIGAIGVLGPELVRLRRAGHSERLVGDDLHSADGVLDLGDLSLHTSGAVRRRLARRRQVEGREVVGRAKSGCGRRWRVDRDGRADHDGRHRDDDEQEDQELLPPLALEEAPGPAEHGSAGGDTSAGRFGGRRGRRPFEDADAHWFGRWARIASGLSTGSV